ncbi:unnamed protein product, partial [Prorocentrum cordatum]
VAVASAVAPYDDDMDDEWADDARRAGAAAGADGRAAARRSSEGVAVAEPKVVQTGAVPGGGAGVVTAEVSALLGRLGVGAGDPGGLLAALGAIPSLSEGDKA